jgi:hypothetical protein
MAKRRSASHRTSAQTVRHVIVKWNPTDSFEPDTIAAHAAILLKHSSVWWGKISKTGRLGLNNDDLQTLQQQLQSGQPIHLYLYCPDKQRPTLHVGLVDQIQNSPPDTWELVPSYYTTLNYPIPYWFRLKDIRQLTTEHVQYLRTGEGRPYDPVASNAYPMVVFEADIPDPFRSDHLGATKWFVLQRLHEGSSAAGLDPRLVFVLMPFAEEFTDVWTLGIKPTVEKMDLSCRRADEFLHNRDIMQVIRDNIHHARLIIADMTTSNPNVFYELGYAHALNKHVLLITKDRDSVPFDLRNINNIEYKHAADLVTKLPGYITSILAL